MPRNSEQLASARAPRNSERELERQPLDAGLCSKRRPINYITVTSAHSEIRIRIFELSVDFEFKLCCSIQTLLQHWLVTVARTLVIILKFASAIWMLSLKAHELIECWTYSLRLPAT